MKYKIKITYDTGDSFENEYGIESYLDGSWNNLAIATENLNRIKEHYQYYQLCTGYNFGKSTKQIEKERKQFESSRWFAGNANDCIYSIKFLTDDGVEYIQSASQWCGYFESLVGAELEQQLPKFTVR